MNKHREQESRPALEHVESLSFLLRAWAEKPATNATSSTWRYSLIDLSTKAQRGFADLDTLMAYFMGIESEVGRNENNEPTQRSNDKCK